MLRWKKTFGLSLGAIALITGAVPGSVSVAGAVEGEEGGSTAKTLIAGSLSALVAVGTLLIILDDGENPVSP